MFAHRTPGPARIAPARPARRDARGRAGPPPARPASSEPHAALDLFGIGWRLGATLFFVLWIAGLDAVGVAAAAADGWVRIASIGLAFREDALEEIVGPLGDEFDDDEDESEETIGGHATARLGRLPRKGDEVRVGPFRARALEVTRRRVARLRMVPVPDEDDLDAAHGLRRTG